MESEVKTAKLSGLSTGTLRRRRSNSRISSIAFGISSCEVALTLIQCCFSSGCSLRSVLSGKMTLLSSGFLPPPKTDFNRCHRADHGEELAFDVDFFAQRILIAE